jgi:hypothetical protein
MRIIKVENIGKRPVYDISVKDVEHYILENGVVTHNTSVMYSANQVFIVSRSQEKDGSDLVGYNFTINIEKSRFVKEKSKLTFQVKFDEGIMKYSGLMDIALKSGFVVKPKNGWYQKYNDEKMYRLAATNNSEFWESLLSDEGFKSAITYKYKLSNKIELVEEEVVEEE